MNLQEAVQSLTLNKNPKSNRILKDKIGSSRRAGDLLRTSSDQRHSPRRAYYYNRYKILFG